jgi:putative transposase
MKFDPEKHRRRSIRLPGYDYSWTGVYFVTFCTLNRENLLGQVADGEMLLNAAGEILGKKWAELPEHFPNVSLDAFMVMPNHVHGVIFIASAGRGAASGAPTLGMVIRAFKSISAIEINRLLGRAGQPLWQRNYYEHIIRNDESLNRIREYILSNPLSWHLDRENLQAQGKDDFDTWLTRL